MNLSPLLNDFVRERFTTWDGRRSMSSGITRLVLAPHWISQNEAIYRMSLRGLIESRATKGAWRSRSTKVDNSPHSGRDSRIIGRGAALRDRRVNFHLAVAGLRWLGRATRVGDWNAHSNTVPVRSEIGQRQDQRHTIRYPKQAPRSRSRASWPHAFRSRLNLPHDFGAGMLHDRHPYRRIGRT
jgi:hypothetical protein